MIRYLLGRSSTGKSEAIHKMIKNRMGQEKQFLIVPEQYTLQAEIELIKDLNSKGFIDVEVISFIRLCTRVLDETGGSDRIPIDSIGKSMILRSILDQSSEELLVFKSIAQKTGFIDKISTLISELKRVGIDDKQLLESVDEENYLNRKIKDVALILHKYNTFMDSDYFDEEDFIRMVEKRLNHVDILKDSIVYIDGFDSFSSQEYSLLEGIFSLSKEINISLTIDIYNDQFKDLFTPVARTFEKLRGIVKKLEIEEKKIEFEKKDFNNELSCLEREFFSYPYTPYEEPVENIEIHLCNNVYDEVDLLARTIENNIRNKSMKYSDMTVVTGDIVSYGQVIKRIFSMYNIPYFIDEKVDIIHHPMVQLILSILSCLHSGFKHEDVLKLIKTRLLDIDEKDAYLFENYILSVGIRGNKWFNTFEDEQMEAIRMTFIQPLQDLKEVIKSKNTIKDLTIHLYKFISQLNVSEKLQSFNKQLEALDRLDKVQETTQIWNMTMKLFDQLVDLKGDEKVTIKDYLRIVEAGFNEMEIGLIPPKIDQVTIGNIERSKNKLSKELFVIGLNDNVLPKKYGDEGLILDDEKRALLDKGIDLETDSTIIMARDYFSTYVAFSKATEKISMSLSLSNYEGKALRPSIYLDKFKRVFPSLKIQSHLLEVDGFNHQYTEELYFSNLTKSLRNAADKKEINPDWFKVLAWYKQFTSLHISTNDLKDALYYDNQSQNLEENKTKELYNLPLITSVSRLERYSRCPFSHFVHYGLRPKARKLHELKLPDIGSLFHRTLELFDQEMKENNINWWEIDKETTNQFIEKIVDDLVVDYNHYIFTSSYRYKYLVKKLKRVGKRAAWTLVLQVKKGKFKPYAHEIAFSSKGQMYTVPPIVIELANGDKMHVEGRIDRIDLYEKNGMPYVKVVDYKSGSKKFNLNEVYHGLQMQLMVYLDAILRSKEYFRVDELHPAGVFYFKIDDPLIENELLKGENTEEEILKLLKMDGLLLKDLEIVSAMDEEIIEKKKSFIIPAELKKDDSFSARSKVVDHEEFSILINYIQTTIADIGTSIKQGDITIKPYKLGAKVGCMSCDYENICQFDSAFGNGYKLIPSLKDDEILDLLKE